MPTKEGYAEELGLPMAVVVAVIGARIVVRAGVIVVVCGNFIIAIGLALLAERGADVVGGAGAALGYVQQDAHQLLLGEWLQEFGQSGATGKRACVR
jgi:hypothetical protein